MIDPLLGLPAELFTPPGTPRRKFDPAHMRLLLGALGDPQLRFRSVLIGGTNGKGSTAAMLAAITASAGYRVGLYTSPHLSKVNERVRLLRGDEDAMIDDESFARLAGHVRGAGDALVDQGLLPAGPSFFETLTAIGMLAFAEQRVDLAVLEVGMGGRLDATNVVEPLFSVITDISLDHTEWLGTTIAAIAREKAGILRPGGVLITLPQHPEANQAIGEVAMALGVRGVNAVEYLPVAAEAGRSPLATRYSVSAFGEQISFLPALAGHHQQRNIALALAAAAELERTWGFSIDADDARKGLEGARWPGRLELRRSTDGPDLLLDVAHNPAAAWALRSAVSALTANADDGSARPCTLVFSCLGDKPVEEMAQILFPVFDKVVLTVIDSPRAATLERLCRAAETVGVAYEARALAADALEAAYRGTPREGLVVVAGSAYLVGRLRPLPA